MNGIKEDFKGVASLEKGSPGIKEALQAVASRLRTLQVYARTCGGYMYVCMYACMYVCMYVCMLGVYVCRYVYMLCVCVCFVLKIFYSLV